MLQRVSRLCVMMDRRVDGWMDQWYGSTVPPMYMRLACFVCAMLLVPPTFGPAMVYTGVIRLREGLALLPASQGGAGVRREVNM